MEKPPHTCKESGKVLRIPASHMCCIVINPMGNVNKTPPIEEGTLNYLEENTHFKKKEIKHIYKKFMKESPDGNLTKGQFVNLYRINGTRENAELIASHLFRAFDLNNSYAIGKCFRNTSFVIFGTCFYIARKSNQ